jgi:hypothetical protein
LVLNKGAQDVAAFVAVVLDDGQLGKHTGGSGHNAAGTNQLKNIHIMNQRLNQIKSLHIITIFDNRK